MNEKNIVNVYKGNSIYRDRRATVKLPTPQWVASCKLCEWDTGAVHLVNKDHAHEVARNHVRVAHPEEIVNNLIEQDEGMFLNYIPR